MHSIFTEVAVKLQQLL